MFNSRFRNSFSTSLGSRSISELSFLDLFLLSGCLEVLNGVKGTAVGSIVEDSCADKVAGGEVVIVVVVTADE